MLKPRILNEDSNKEIQLLPLEECLAKTVAIGSSKIVKPGINVFWHCYLTGLVAREIIHRTPDWLKSALFPAGSDFIVSLHDVGKLWHVFQEKIYRALRTDKYPKGKELGIANPALANGTGGHAEVSQLSINKYGEYLAAIVGRHHGFSNSTIGLPSDAKYGGAKWQTLRESLIELLKNELNAQWPSVTSDAICNVLTGLTCVSDWISSGAFAEMNDFSSDDHKLLLMQVNEAIDNAGLIRPIIRKNLTFETIFGFTKRQIQEDFIKQVDDKGVYILEAPMGLGKTEAALYAAYKCLENGLATGIYFALPTQLTSDKMYERMHSFLSTILECDSSNQKPLLLHSSAWLKDTSFGEDGAPGKSWFDSGKRGILAPFAVGTVDQALMAAMNVKHGFVRTFGLAGKVVILDEIHSYDMYTGTLLDELVKVLIEVHCTVIILSATLTTQRRVDILSEHGSVADSAYPLISKKAGNKPLHEYVPVQNEHDEVKVNFITEDSVAIEEVLLRAECGQQVLWIENTIGEAQALYKKIGARAANIGVEYGLLHSRYIKKDRVAHEKKWVDLFGKEGGINRKEHGRILIGTQILEQSLDIDADFLVTRLCPSDMLFQRIGRLWRHRANDILRPKNTNREIWVLTPPFSTAFTENGAFGKTGLVYEPYLLCRSLEVWADKKKVTIPVDIPIFLKETYAVRDETGLLAHYKYELQNKCAKLRQLALVGISSAGNTLPEERASTRHSDYGTVDVLLLRSYTFDRGTEVRTRFLDASEITFDIEGTKNRKKQRAIAAELLHNTVRVPQWLAPNVSLQQLKWLEPYAYIGNEKDGVLFSAAKVRAGGELYGLGDENSFSEYQVTYTGNMGYCAVKVANNVEVFE